MNEEMALLVSDKFHIESRLPVQLKGLRDKVTPYCVLGPLANRDFIHMPAPSEAAAKKEAPTQTYDGEQLFLGPF